MGNLINLTGLNLSNNQLNGRISSSIGNLTNLITLCLFNNHLKGPIPSSIGNLTNLTNLYLYNNNLKGPIPSSIGNLTNLINLSLFKNDLDGPIPSSIGNLTNLKRMCLQSNQFNGSIPSSIENLQNLNEISVDIDNVNDITFALSFEKFHIMCTKLTRKYWILVLKPTSYIHVGNYEKESYLMKSLDCQDHNRNMNDIYGYPIVPYGIKSCNLLDEIELYKSKPSYKDDKKSTYSI